MLTLLRFHLAFIFEFSGDLPLLMTAILLFFPFFLLLTDLDSESTELVLDRPVNEEFGDSA